MPCASRTLPLTWGVTVDVLRPLHCHPFIPSHVPQSPPYSLLPLSDNTCSHGMADAGDTQVIIRAPSYRCFDFYDCPPVSYIGSPRRRLRWKFLYKN